MGLLSSHIRCTRGGVGMRLQRGHQEVWATCQLDAPVAVVQQRFPEEVSQAGSPHTPLRNRRRRPPVATLALRCASTLAPSDAVRECQPAAMSQRLKVVAESRFSPTPLPSGCGPVPR